MKRFWKLSAALFIGLSSVNLAFAQQTCALYSGCIQDSSHFTICNNTYDQITVSYYYPGFSPTSLTLPAGYPHTMIYCDVTDYPYQVTVTQSHDDTTGNYWGNGTGTPNMEWSFGSASYKRGDAVHLYKSQK